MKINIISFGKVKNKDLINLINDYLKKISFFIKIKEIELEEITFKKESDSNKSKALELEAKEISKYIPNAFNIALCIEGEQIDSIKFAKKIDSIFLNNSNFKNINFIIGSSYGISEEVKKICDLKISFSLLTFPHQLMRLILLEQIYRSFTINKNINYHK